MCVYHGTQVQRRGQFQESVLPFHHGSQGSDLVLRLGSRCLPAGPSHQHPSSITYHCLHMEVRGQLCGGSSLYHVGSRD